MAPVGRNKFRREVHERIRQIVYEERTRSAWASLQAVRKQVKKFIGLKHLTRMQCMELNAIINSVMGDRIVT